MPIAHGEGNFYLPDEELDRLEGEGQVVFRYVTRDGRLDDEANVNGSARAIAGVCNERPQRGGPDAAPGARRRARAGLAPTAGACSRR